MVLHTGTGTCIDLPTTGMQYRNLGIALIPQCSVGRNRKGCTSTLVLLWCCARRYGVATAAPTPVPAMKQLTCVRCAATRHQVKSSQRRSSPIAAKGSDSEAPRSCVVPPPSTRATSAATRTLVRVQRRRRTKTPKADLLLQLFCFASSSSIWLNDLA